MADNDNVNTEKRTSDPLPENKAQEKGYHDQSVQQRMNRPTPEQQRTAGRSGGEDIEGQTPVDKSQGQGAIASDRTRPGKTDR